MHQGLQFHPQKVYMTMHALIVKVYSRLDLGSMRNMAFTGSTGNESRERDGYSVLELF